VKSKPPASIVLVEGERFHGRALYRPATGIGFTSRNMGFMQGWTLKQVRDYCQKNNLKLTFKE
jgi:hypothetical protein